MNPRAELIIYIAAAMLIVMGFLGLMEMFT
jgi:hypothetical protein